MNFPSIHREGWPFIGAFAAVTVTAFIFVGPLSWLGLMLTAWCVYFFRDPARVTPVRKGLIVAPADGVVLPLIEAIPPVELDMGVTPRTKISIFMNVFDVHVNRIPCDGEVIGTAYRPGKFFNASLDKASEHNERMSVRIRPAEHSAGCEDDLCVVQIAGLVARRIKCNIVVGQSVHAGERFGIIRFGSRVDVYLPTAYSPLVVTGQRSVAGETVLANARTQEAQHEKV